mmetsp:Transcript_21112/g.60258  ORF Transcript_21112/g.60258 Transcript_21112/m.60258 type:complete len:211 (-) Transcript_21112:828-1460(-)
MERSHRSMNHNKNKCTCEYAVQFNRLSSSSICINLLSSSCRQTQLNRITIVGAFVWCITRRLFLLLLIQNVHQFTLDRSCYQCHHHDAQHDSTNDQAFIFFQLLGLIAGGYHGRRVIFGCAFLDECMRRCSQKCVDQIERQRCDFCHRKGMQFHGCRPAHVTDEAQRQHGCQVQHCHDLHAIFRCGSIYRIKDRIVPHPFPHLISHQVPS